MRVELVKLQSLLYIVELVGGKLMFNFFFWVGFVKLNNGVNFGLSGLLNQLSMVLQGEFLYIFFG